MKEKLFQSPLRPRFIDPENDHMAHNANIFRTEQPNMKQLSHNYNTEYGSSRAALAGSPQTRR